jgi:hypothetical protein
VQHEVKQRRFCGSVLVVGGEPRERLRQIEALLEVSLKDAGDIASVFLALTALDLSGLLTARSDRLAARPADRTGRAADVAATGAATEYPTERASLGVVVGGND